MKKVLLFAVVFSCSMWANAQCVTWATEAGLSAIQRTGYGECWRPSTRLGISADYNVNNVFSMKSGLYYTFRGYSVNNGVTYSNGDATWIENVSQTRHFLQVPIWVKISIHSNNSTKFFFEIGPYIGYCIKIILIVIHIILLYLLPVWLKDILVWEKVRRVVATSFYINMREISTGE